VKRYLFPGCRLATGSPIDGQAVQLDVAVELRRRGPEEDRAPRRFTRGSIDEDGTSDGDRCGEGGPAQPVPGGWTEDRVGFGG
jgi:hypothetical protein